MKNNRFWIIIIASVLLTSCAAAYFAAGGGSGSGTFAVIRHEGKELYRINLDEVDEPYTIEIEGRFHNTVRVEHGRIRVESADCPDKICVESGWISEKGKPIVCLPNGLSIEIEGGKGTVDGTVQ